MPFRITLLGTVDAPTRTSDGTFLAGDAASRSDARTLVSARNRLISGIPAIKTLSSFTAIARDLPVMRVVR